jgi:TolB-like protein/DNA-binding winged helix-turn-helix (wHTH) protein
MSLIQDEIYEFGSFSLEVRQRSLRRGEGLVPLTQKAFEVLLHLVRSGGNLVSRDELMNAVWEDSFVEESNLTQTIFMLRKVLGDTKEQPYILTIQGKGYRFVRAVNKISASEINAHEINQQKINEHKMSATVAPPVAEKADSLPAGWVAANPEPTPPRRIKQTGTAVRLLALAAIALLALASFLLLHWRHNSQATLQPTSRFMLAVLPFENLTGDASQEYFSDGMTEEMITQLGRMDPSRLGVIARTSVMQYKKTSKALPQVGQELGVQYVLEGSVRRDGDRIRVTAQLIQLKDQTHLWAQEYDRELKDLLVVQGDISREIASAIERALGAQSAEFPASPAISPQRYEAYDLYLKGLFFWNKRTNEGFTQAIHYFQLATEKDPDYAPAYALLADAYTMQGAYNGAPAREFVEKARTAAKRAVELDDHSAEAHTALALVTQNQNYDWQTSEREFRRAIELNPGYATAHHWYAEHLMWEGRFDEALAESEEARKLDPLSLIIVADKGYILYCARKYDESIQQLRSVLDMDPKFSRGSLIYFVYAQKGMFPAIYAELDSEPASNAAWYWSMTAYLYGLGGRTQQANHSLQKLKELEHAQMVDPMVMVLAAVGTGNNDQAIAWMQKAYAQRSNELVRIKVDPAYDPLRKDPRFHVLLSRVGLDQ